MWLRGRRGAVPGNSCSWLFPSNLHRRKAVLLGSRMGDNARPKRTELCATVNRGKSVSKWPKPQGWVDRLAGSGASERNSNKNMRTKILR